MTRTIVLCADDFGLSPGIDRAIIDLLEKERLTAVSCMTVFPEFAVDAPRLKPHLDRADIGLHVTLTHSRPLLSVLVAGWLGLLDRKAVAVEVERQAALFTAAMGRPPAYLDGHQHVHLIPAVADAVCNVALKCGAYVRLAREPAGAGMLKRPSAWESFFLSQMSRPLAHRAARLRLRANGGFRGVRNFRERTPYRVLFRRMIENAAPGSIVMCHPGSVDEVLCARDGVTHAREDEYRYFAGEEFPKDLRAAGMALGRLAA